MSQARRQVYRLARTMGDVEAAAKGPSALGRRIVRKSVYRRSGSATRRLLKLFGL